uniref:WD_REPEATS_REGION domain-containing protein n=1 Tax=Parastrongyloides trichosuri TaxID=131310 RepID=A0A0N4Z5X0_PARTI
MVDDKQFPSYMKNETLSQAASYRGTNFSDPYFIENNDVNFSTNNSFSDDVFFADGEPRLNYERIVGDIEQCFSSQSPTAITFSDKFIAAGFKLGYILLFDHTGLGHKEIPTRKHNAKILSLSFDGKSNYLGSLSADGMISVFGLSSSTLNVIINLKEVPNSICLSPDYYVQGNGAKLVIGGKNLLLYKKGFISGTIEVSY